ncbi:MAG TPA: DUF4402 domain-containing protein [Sphingomicrobium sp.]|nr:DUF4402 domain-containing protein [Sphingomicrobium sp.]
MNFVKILIAGALAATAMPAAAAPVAAPTPATGRALLLVPLTLTKVDDLDFGTIVTSPSPGVVVIDAATGARTMFGGVTPVTSDPGRRARFAGAGTPGQAVVVTVTPPLQLTNTAGDAIPVLALTTEGGAIHTIDTVTRAFFFGVGGIIQVNANQPEGVYSANFIVTANYQ